MKVKNILLAAVVTASTLAGQAYATGDSYIGMSFGSTDTDTGITNATTLTEGDSGFKVFYGFGVSSNFDIELHYADLGEVSATDGTIFVSGESNSIGASGVYNFVEEGSFSPFVKLGIHRWSADAVGSSGNVSVAVSDDGFDVNWGVGADINISENFAIRAEYEMYKLDDSDTTLISIGAKFTF
jgi:OOP family OmpA-OmpF porin